MLDLTKLQNRSVNELNYSDTITIDKSMYENTDIRNLSDVKVNAHIKRVTDSSYNMSLIIDGVMTLPCSVTLKDVLYPFHIETEVKISNDDENLEEYVKIIQNSIDILPIIWQNIALEIPLKVVSDDVSDTPTSGDGWKLVSLDD
ncbi:putative uncharacterized protein [Clostridium sp. CAG:1193]|nr:putative uncharacterized protein [Clostridium sp. CAG:1193]